MPFEKGQSGNPGGRRTEKIYKDAVMLALREEDETTKRQKLRMVADKLVEQALAGEGWAIKEIGDRIDGKPAQAVELGGADGGAIVVQVTSDDDKL